MHENKTVKTAVQQAAFNQVIEVQFADEGYFSLNTLQDQRKFNVQLASTKKNDIQNTTVPLTKPTVFESYSFFGGKNRIQRYLVFKNDTLQFKFLKEGSVFTGNKKNDILNVLIEDHVLYEIREPANTSIYTTDLRKKHDKNLEKLKELTTSLNDDYAAALADYLKLYFYYNLFNINFSKIKDAEVLEKLDGYYDELFKNIKLLEKINTIATKRLVSGLLRYNAFKNKNSFVENLPALQKKFAGTQILNGYLLDILAFDKDLTEEVRIEIKKYVKLDHTKDSSAGKSVRLYAAVLNSDFYSFNDQVTKFKDLIKTDKKLIFIDLWASWCVPCIQEIPKLQVYKKKFGDQVHFVSISIDKNTPDWKRAALKYNLDDEFSVLVKDPRKNEFVKEFRINAIPRFMLLNRNREIISEDFNRPTDDQFENDLSEVLEKTPDHF